MASSTHQKLRPYRQGDLDALCGPYAIVNAFRWCLGDHPIAAKGPHWASLFGVLHDYAVKELGYLGLASSGLSLNGMIWMLRTAQEHMRDEHELSFASHRPFARRRPQQPDEVSGSIAAHLSSPCTATVVAFYGHLNHWGVITNVRPDGACLFDSSRINRLPISALHPAAFVPRERSRSHIQPGSVLQIRWEPGGAFGKVSK